MWRQVLHRWVTTHAPPERVVAVTDAATLSSSPFVIFGGIWVLASLGGLAELLRSKKTISPRIFFSALINSGLAGLSVGLLLYEKVELPVLLGVSIISGVGGMTLLDLLVQGLKLHGLKLVAIILKGALSLTTDPTKDDDNNSKPSKH